MTAWTRRLRCSSALTSACFLVSRHSFCNPGRDRAGREVTQLVPGVHRANGEGAPPCPPWVYSLCCCWHHSC